MLQSFNKFSMIVCDWHPFSLPELNIGVIWGDFQMDNKSIFMTDPGHIFQNVKFLLQNKGSPQYFSSFSLRIGSAVLAEFEQKLLI